MAIHKWPIVVTVIALISHTSAPPVQAATATAVSQMRAAISQLTPDTSVLVTLRSGKQVSGYIRSVHQYSFIVTNRDDSTSTQIAYGSVKTVRGHHVSTKTVIIIVALAAALLSWLACYGAGGCGGFSERENVIHSELR
jgi:small nuclear ribonucleoprotein (snRNP)-like protein